MTRLTDEQRRDRAVSEADLQNWVVDLAGFFGWSWVHFRAGRTAHGWSVPISGPLGEGWPDLILLRPRDGRALAVELKAELGKPTAKQVAVLAAMASCGMEVALWRPSDFAAGRIEAALRDRASTHDVTELLRGYDYQTEGFGGT